MWLRGPAKNNTAPNKHESVLHTWTVGSTGALKFTNDRASWYHLSKIIWLQKNVMTPCQLSCGCHSLYRNKQIPIHLITDSCTECRIGDKWVKYKT